MRAGAAAGSAIALILLAGPGAALAADHTLTVPFTEKTNLQAYDPEFNPRYHYDPFIRIRLMNPDTGIEQDVSALLDTGADSCVVGEDVVARLGLHTIDAPLIELRTGGGPIKVPYVKLSYRLRTDQGAIVDEFPRQTTHCLVAKEPKIPIVLGFIGFIDRFKSITIRYPTSLELTW